MKAAGQSSPYTCSSCLRFETKGYLRLCWAFTMKQKWGQLIEKPHVLGLSNLFENTFDSLTLFFCRGCPVRRRAPPCAVASQSNTAVRAHTMATESNAPKTSAWNAGEVGQRFGHCFGQYTCSISTLWQNRTRLAPELSAGLHRTMDHVQYITNALACTHCLVALHTPNCDGSERLMLLFIYTIYGL